MLVIEDEFTRECLELDVRGRRFSGQQVSELLVALFVIRGVPTAIRSDNGGEFVGRAVQGVLKAAAVTPLPVEAGVNAK